MVQAIEKMLGDKYYLPSPVILNSPASKFWGPKNMVLMFVQAVKRFFQFLKYGKPQVLLDCSGYQYGDPWAAMGKVLSLRLVAYQYFKARGGQIILMPQTLGPFSNQISASTAAGVFQIADYVFTRDETSLTHAVSVGCPDSRITIMPDYSNITDAETPANPIEWQNRVGIVPSVRMLDKTPEKVSSNYMDILHECINWIIGHKMEPFILVHDLEDKAFAEELNKSMDERVMIVSTSPSKAKGIIAACKALVSSRYHGIVSALSQATPVIGTGWTHKYKALFKDYDCLECLVECVSVETLQEALNLICEEPGRSNIIKKLRIRADKNLSRTREMFTQLENIINSSKIQ